AVKPAHSHHAARHVFVATGYGDQPVIILAAADGLDAVSDDVAADERIADAVGGVEDSVAHANSVEHQPHEVILPNTFLHQLCEVVEVHVARVAIVAHAGDAYLCFVHILVGQADAV